MEEKIGDELTAITEDEKSQLRMIFAAGTCKPIITKVEKEGLNPESFYDAVFKYAIFCNAHEFITKMLTDEKIISYMSHEPLFEYAKSQDLNFQKLALAIMVNQPSPNRDFSIVNEFQAEVRTLFNAIDSPSNVAPTNLIKQILQLNPLIKSESRALYLKTWVFACTRNLNTAKNKDKVREIFLEHLPNNEDCLQHVATLLINSASLSKDNIFSILRSLCARFSFNTAMIANVLGGIYNAEPLQIALNIFIDLFDKKHADYEKYQLLTAILEADPEERPSLILKNLEILSPVALSENLVWCLIESLGPGGQKIFIEWYINTPGFAYGPLLCEYLTRCNAELITQYLTAAHVQLPNNFLFHLLRRFKSNELTNLIQLLLPHPNYILPKRDLYASLSELLNRGDKNSIAALLNNTVAFNLLKKYEQESGDDELSIVDRGTLMPSIIAYYVSHPGKAQELLFSFSNEMRKKLLQSVVNYCIDPSQPTLQVAIIQHGDPDLIEAIGGIQPRFISKNEANKLMIFAPQAWHAPKVLATLRKVQLNKANQFAKNLSDSLLHSRSSNNASVDPRAQYLARHCDIDNLILQHETTYLNAQTALFDSRLKTRLHIENHRIKGKAANGLTIPNQSALASKSAFAHFTRTPLTSDKSSMTTHFTDLKQADAARFVFNAPQLLKENPHITFIILGDYPNLQQKNLQLPDGTILTANPNHLTENKNIRRIEFNNSNEGFNTIHENLFEVVFTQIIDLLAEPLKSTMIKKLGDLSLEANRQLARELLNIINLEWLIPGDIPLKLSYVDHLELGEKSYNLSQLRHIATYDNEDEVLKAIANCEGIEQLPFVVNGILAIAHQRQQKNVVHRMAQLKTINNANDITYYPNEVYQIESLIQLLLEDLNNDRVYVHFTGDKILINSTLLQNTNRGGAHRAEMAKLHYALGIGQMQGKNALQIVLESSLELTIGEDQLFKSLADVRDALLSYELTTLLVSQQNTAFYQNNNGEFHPVTGKGATSGTIALLAQRLSLAGSSYELKAHYSEDNKNLKIHPSNPKALNLVASHLAKALQIPAEKINIDHYSITIAISPFDLIATLRRQAIFYEGINVFTEQGSLLLAYRHDKGLASAGGHHSDKYSPKGISYGLRSEFGLVFKEPDNFEQNVVLMKNIKTISKTGIYVVSLNSLQATQEAQNYAHKKQIPVAFYADPDEFVAGSEIVLSLSQMRGQQFYDVMPLTELCEYQLNLLQNYLSQTFPEILSALSFTINSHVDNISTTTVMYKVPAARFGEMTIASSVTLPQTLKDVFTEKGKLVKGSIQTYVFDENPLAMIQFIREALSATYQNFLN